MSDYCFTSMIFLLQFFVCCFFSLVHKQSDKKNFNVMSACHCSILIHNANIINKSYGNHNPLQKNENIFVWSTAEDDAHRISGNTVQNVKHRDGHLRCIINIQRFQCNFIAKSRDFFSSANIIRTEGTKEICTPLH